jgi:hypothetical protein
MTGSVLVSLEYFKKFSKRTIVRDWIRNRYNCSELKGSVFITAEYDPPIKSFAVGILNVIESLRIRLPYIDFHSYNRAPLGVFDRSNN